MMCPPYSTCQNFGKRSQEAEWHFSRSTCQNLLKAATEAVLRKSLKQCSKATHCKLWRDDPFNLASLGTFISFCSLHILTKLALPALRQLRSSARGSNLCGSTPAWPSQKCLLKGSLPLCWEAFPFALLLLFFKKIILNQILTSESWTFSVGLPFRYLKQLITCLFSWVYFWFILPSSFIPEILFLVSWSSLLLSSELVSISPHSS